MDGTPAMQKHKAIVGQGLTTALHKASGEWLMSGLNTEPPAPKVTQVVRKEHGQRKDARGIRHGLQDNPQRGGWESPHPCQN